MQRLQKIGHGQHLNLVKPIWAWTAVYADHAVKLDARYCCQGTQRLIPPTVPPLGPLDLDSDHPRRASRPAASSLDDKVYLHTGRSSVVRQWPVLAADLVVDA